MELVINIDEETYKTILHCAKNTPGYLNCCEMMIADGKPLPKGHGRLIDENKITKFEQIGLVIKDDNVIRCLVTDAPTIIEADRQKERMRNDSKTAY